MKRCKRRLAALWFGASGLLFFVVLIQTYLGHYGDAADDAWGWLLPNTMPTLSLVVAVLAMDATRKSVETRTVDSFFFGLSFILSAGYLLALALTVFVQPFSPSPLEPIKDSTLWLGPFQGLVTGAIGAFFVKKGR
ncbi:MAG: hypothetical protein JO166_19660 [Deltaproteobacteria bacterium]|nr:hypothetical protein [Deltaproteobacteria bacterium]